MKNKFAMTTLIGLVGGVACVVIAIAEAGNLKLFVNIPSLLIIVGGTVFALILSYPASSLKTLGSVIKQAFTNNTFDLSDDINTIVELSEIIRREGVLALEKYIDDNEGDSFLTKGLNMLLDGINRDELEEAMMNEIHLASRRHQVGYSMINMIATLAPALGLVGTYVGLIPMLVDLMNPETLGPLMAVELVSSFYGGFLAYVIFAPMSKKLMVKNAQEKNRNEMILEGILSIQEGKNPRLIRDNLTAYLTRDEIRKLPPYKAGRSSEPSDAGVIDYKTKRKSMRRGA